MTTVALPSLSLPDPAPGAILPGPHPGPDTAATVRGVLTEIARTLAMIDLYAVEQMPGWAQLPDAAGTGRLLAAARAFTSMAAPHSTLPTDLPAEPEPHLEPEPAETPLAEPRLRAYAVSLDATGAIRHTPLDTREAVADLLGIPGVAEEPAGPPAPAEPPVTAGDPTAAAAADRPRGKARRRG